jgi:hypothetical protein
MGRFLLAFEEYIKPRIKPRGFVKRLSLELGFWAKIILPGPF